ncbi:MAG: hypothetical protein QGH93_05605 [Gammaproteobacteria bacterium]|jgi:hypothetical protein|nr:hypothetical protein [Chromatiales bacterium]MDP6674311.1 hypothetical protein [Gammaproteobacteria bacterium]
MQAKQHSTAISLQHWNTAMMRHWLSAILLVSGIFLFQGASNASITVNVVDPDGTPVAGFRWLLEEDNTAPVITGEHVVPGPVTPGSEPEAALGPNPGSINNLSISIHRSHSPVVKSGETVSDEATISTLSDEVTPLPDRRYMLSVLPLSGDYTVGGANVAAGQTEVTIIVTPHPLGTAQITVKVFEDLKPLNNWPNATEPGLEGFKVRLKDTADSQMQDIYGNPVGTTYEQGADCGLPDPDEFCFDGDDNPIVVAFGPGYEVTDENGEAEIKYLAPGKYGVVIIPPIIDPDTGLPVEWHQTTTIEGTPLIDAWVRPDEPAFWVEFGPLMWHTFFGFVRNFDGIDGGTVDVTGQGRKGRTSRPPAIEFSDGPPPSTSACQIGVNALVGGGTTEAVYVATCEEDGFFTIEDVPNGTYQLVMWDAYLDHIIGFSTFIVDDLTPATLELGSVLTPMWFGEHEHWVFFDTDGDGFRDPGELGMPEQNVNLRWRDGSIIQAFPTDLGGYVPFEEVFPRFHWEVAEIDFGRYKATGLTTVVDDGGPVPDEVDLPEGTGYQDPAVPFAEGRRNPAIDPDTGNPYFTQTGPVLTQAYQTFATQNVRFEWGKQLYESGQNGGISGMVFYATTRAEDDPRYAAGEEWETGIPRVQVNLYEDFFPDEDGIPDDQNGVAGDADTDGSDGFNKADVDNYPLGWADGEVRGGEDVDWNDNGVFDTGDAVRVTWTDSWDDNLPEGCVGSVLPLEIHATTIPITDCVEGLRTWNQTRPGLFDGGYAFGPNVTGDGSPELVAGMYIVETATPPGYVLLKEEDRNVDFGLTFIPSPLLLPPVCVGDDHIVPAEMSLFPGEPAPWAGEPRPLCDRKQIMLSDKQNAAGDFFLFTYVPKSARMVGLVTNDLGAEIDPAKPQFQEKYAPPWIPISVRDYSNKEILRFYADEFGQYNALVPSTYSIDIANATGVGPAMHEFCLNHPGPIANVDFDGAPGDGTDGDGDAEFVTDPAFSPLYSTTCFNYDFWPGKTTYLDTPVVSTAAYVGPSQEQVDCECADGTPVIRDVMGPGGMPAFVPTAGGTVTITSMGTIQVPNPGYPGGMDPPVVPKTIPRDYGFGVDEGTVTVGAFEIDPADVTWTNGAIELDLSPLPAGLATGQLMVTNSAGVQTKIGLTLVVGDEIAPILVVGAGEAFTSIQSAVDAASDGTLILVKPGIYRENIIVTKKLRIQGAGAGSTIVDAIHFPGTALTAYRVTLDALLLAGEIGILPGQGDPDPTRPFFNGQEGSGFLVAPLDGVFDATDPARIDGFQIRGADLGSAIFVNAYAHELDISNNKLISNKGLAGGGIRVGSPSTTAVAFGIVQEIETSPNDNLDIHHNHVLYNSSWNNGGGVAIHDGADNYSVVDNLICGNRANWGGGGVAHVGRSDGGLIANNMIIFNEQFQGDQIGLGSGGGGIDIFGEPASALEWGNDEADQDEDDDDGDEDDAPIGTLTKGTGSVQIISNLVQGNMSGAGDGGGINLRFINGQDVEASADPADWYSVEVYNNMVVNNVSGVAGGGIGLQDVAQASIVHNTVANNDSIAIGALAFAPGVIQEESTPQVGGIVSRAHSEGLAGVLPVGESDFSDPAFFNNIIWHNRSFYWDADVPASSQLVPLSLHPSNATGSDYWDLGVIGTDTLEQLSPTNTILSALLQPDTVLYYPSDANEAGDPQFVAEYSLTIRTGAEPEEGGNFITGFIEPLSLWNPLTGALLGDYHVSEFSPAGSSALPVDYGAIPELAADFDGATRPEGSTTSADCPVAPCPDIGADELPAGVYPGEADADWDGVTDDVDNCTDVANADQRDTNGDGYGNICDADLNNDGVVNFADFGIMRSVFFTADPDADLNGDGFVNFSDFGILKAMFFSPPGPSGTAP